MEKCYVERQRLRTSEHLCRELGKEEEVGKCKIPCRSVLSKVNTSRHWRGVSFNDYCTWEKSLTWTEFKPPAKGRRQGWGCSKKSFEGFWGGLVHGTRPPGFVHRCLSWGRTHSYLYDRRQWGHGAAGHPLKRGPYLPIGTGSLSKPLHLETWPNSRTPLSA